MKAGECCSEGVVERLFLKKAPVVEIQVTNEFGCAKKILPGPGSPFCYFHHFLQLLRIKAFYRTSDNDVKTQIGVAVSVYVPIAILKKEYAPKQST